MTHALSLALLLVAPQAQDLKAIVAECEKDTQTKIRAGEIKSQEQWVANIDKFCAKIDFSKVTLDDAGFLLDSIFQNSDKAKQGIRNVLVSVKPSGEVEAVRVSVLTLMARENEALDSNDYMKVASMKGAKAYLAETDGRRLVTLATGLDSTNPGSGKAYSALFKLVDDKTPMLVLISIGGIWSDYSENFSKDKDFQGNWNRVVKAMDKSLASAPKDAPKANVDRLKRTREVMNSNGYRGKLIGYTAPEIDFLWTSSGTAKKLSDLKGKVVVVDFWATWCGPCIASMPKIRELAEHYKGQPVEIYGITSIQGMHIENGKNTDTKGKPEEEMKLMEGYIQRQNINWTIAFSKTDAFDPGFGVRGIPYMAILDGKGVVRYAGLHPGALTLEQKQALIDPLIKELKGSK